MSGHEIKSMILDAGLYLWQVADALSIADSNFSRKLRHDFSDEDAAKVISIIDELKAKK